MKPSSLLVVVVTTALITLCTSFSSGKGASPSKLSPVSKEYQGQRYYWYLSNGDVYDGWSTPSTEIGRLETMYGVYVDANPANAGFQLARAFVYYGTPHLIWPSITLYGHY
ncbi:MAG TPA: hypothetical protein VGN00_29495 [Puia sp.]|jgi:hypothetical protein